MKYLGLGLLSPNNSRKKKVTKSHVLGLKMEIYEFKDWSNSAYRQNNISKIFTFLYNTSDFFHSVVYGSVIIHFPSLFL